MLYGLMVKRFGMRAANIGTVLLRGVLIALVVLFSDKGFSDFAYMNL
jgi:hypothetical protein